MTREDYPVTRSGMARFEPLDRFHWPSIVGGAFLALSLFVISVVLSRAIGLDYTYQTARTEGQRNTIIIWGVVAAFICFWLGSWLAVRTAVVATRGYGLLNGMMVWALAVPVLVYSLGSNLGPRLGLTSVEPIPTALRASAQFAPSQPYHPSQSAAWWMLASLASGFVAAILAGWLGVKRVGVSERPVT